MRFGLLAGNEHINSRIYELLGNIDPSDAPAFARKFKEERNEQRFHTFRELILGAQLRGRGLNMRYEQKILGKTPDWVAIGPNGEVEEIFDVASLHQRNATEADMYSAISAGHIWSGWVTIPPDHIYSKVEQKADAYSALVEATRKPYVVCLFGEFMACVDPEEVEYVLEKHHGGLFRRVPTLAGVIYFFEQSGSYRYCHFSNPAAHFRSSYLERQANAP
jgi:hypothetical protein